MSMITAYERPQDLDAAAALLAKSGTALLGGGARIVPALPADVEMLIDLGDLKLNTAEVRKSALHLGAGLRLEELVMRRDCDGLLAEAALVTAPSLNLRNQMTLGGETAWRSPTGDIQELHTALLATDAVVHRHGEGPITIADYLGAETRGGIITSIEIPQMKNRRFRFAVIEAARGARPVLALALAATIAQGRLADLRIALSAPGQPVLRLFSSEQVLEGKAVAEVDPGVLTDSFPDLTSPDHEAWRQWSAALIIRFLIDLAGEVRDAD